MPHEQTPIATRSGLIRKIISGLRLQAGESISRVANKIVPVYVANDEGAIIGMHNHGPNAFPKGDGPISSLNEIGEITNVSENYVQQTQERDLGANAEEIFYTVTTGRTLYVTTMTLRTTVAATFYISDGDAARPVINVAASNGILSAISGAAETLVITFPIPMRFSTAITIEVQGAMSVFFSFTGFEVVN